MKRLSSVKSSLAVIAAAAMLTACGGDSDPVLSLSGVAATGLAIEGGAVAVQCKSGTGSATTNSAGNYTVTVVNGTGPCLVTVTSATTPPVVLRSIAQPDANGQAVANVTPISNAIVNAIATAKGVADVTTLVSGSQAPSNNDISSAASSVITVIKDALIAAGQNALANSLSAANLLSDPSFTAATTTNPNAGSALDQAMDLLIPSGQTALPDAIIQSINTAVENEVDPTPTGSTGAN